MKKLISTFLLNEELINNAVIKYNVILTKNKIKLYQLHENIIIAYWYYIGYCDYTGASCYLIYNLIHKKYEVQFLPDILKKTNFIYTKNELKELNKRIYIYK